jgi:hypothetical protein
MDFPHTLLIAFLNGSFQKARRGSQSWIVLRKTGGLTCDPLEKRGEGSLSGKSFSVKKTMTLNTAVTTAVRGPNQAMIALEISLVTFQPNGGKACPARTKRRWQSLKPLPNRTRGVGGGILPTSKTVVGDGLK